ncbi:GNAT family N-acetyltransferase [Rummeliibacillus sp. SL167]|uniref:GNAT family N-acetyltransferase n=1 Tax=Rummeliibacillus sp. SL167 TaxID=2579792 RepID=UPI0011B59429|nr:GNAT family N-acetyltransferase [Rummeliibacillus sp. SL167]
MTNITQGFLGETLYRVQVLTKKDIPQLLKLQDEVMAALSDRHTVQPLSVGELNNILTGNGLMIGIYVEDELIAFRAVLKPIIDEEHLGRDCGIPDEELSRVLYQEISNVSPRYRGYGLQKKMAQIIMAQVDLNRFDYICATVQPLNIPSLKDKFSQGLMIAGLKVKYGDKLRYIFYKELKGEVPTFSEARALRMSDITGQQQLLKEGFLGTDMFEMRDHWFVTYRK